MFQDPNQFLFFRVLTSGLGYTIGFIKNFVINIFYEFIYIALKKGNFNQLFCLK